MMGIRILFILIILFLANNAFANNLLLKNLNVINIDNSSQTMTLNFDLTQENSWYTATNFDAVWIFMKFSTDGGRTWKHASMKGSGINPAGYNIPNNFQIDVAQDNKGFFFHRSVNGTGNISVTNIGFVWNYSQDGLTTAEAQSANTLHKLFGIEMVYIPSGSFYVGDGNSSSEYHLKAGSTDDNPWYISSENAFYTTNSSSNGFYYVSTGAAGENNSGDVFLVQASFPKGFNSFYLMKYELTEGQWVSFFNTLSNAAKLNRDITSSNLGGKNSQNVVNRNTILWDSTNPLIPAKTLRPSRAMSYLSWPDLAAYSSWAGLRPITELEFEKAARGKDIAPVADEFAWGNSSHTDVTGADINPSNSDEDGTEIINGGANIHRSSASFTTGDGRSGGIADGQSGPLRVGIFAYTTSNRISSGSGFYGNMELSGNVAEPVVTLGKSQGRQFLGTHGTGQLTTISGYEGNATNTDWPGFDNTNPNRGVRFTTGIGYKGGDFSTANIRAFQISSRSFVTKDPDSQNCFQRYDSTCGVFYGGRLGRTAP